MGKSKMHETERPVPDGDSARARKSATKPTAASDDFWSNNFAALLVVLIAFSFFTKLVGVEEPPTEVYDEVYYAFTAGLMAEGDPVAYSVHAKPPEGHAYEWTHPPLGKLIIAAGILLFGDHPFGWRISSVLFGTIITLLTTILAYELFKSPKIALLAGFFTCVEGLLFVQSRTSMIDVHVITFILASVYFYVRWARDAEKRLFNLFALGTCLGLAAATKWNSVFITLLIGSDLVHRWLIERSLPFRNWVAWFTTALVLLPASIYLASHMQFFALGYSLDAFTDLQRSMWWYHSNLTATHAYSSSIWEWLANIKPVWMYRGELDGRTRLIYGIGNHVILYSGLVAVGVSMWRLRRQWSWEVWMLVLGYFSLFVPWCLSPRIKFFYHYAPAVPFLCIMLAHTLHLTTRDTVEGPEIRKSYATSTTVVASFIWFAVLYVFLTGLPVRKAFIDVFDLIIENPLGPT